jgi:hypothetical protein
MFKAVFVPYFFIQTGVILIPTLKHKAMLEYAKIILPKVSFSRELFAKELRKCINWVEENQQNELYTWCNANFREMYPDVLSRAFAGIAA